MNNRRIDMQNYTWTKFIILLICLLVGFAGRISGLPLGGTYSVGGAGADFYTLQAALSQLNSEGQSSAVYLQLHAGTYEGPFVLCRPSSEYDLVITASGTDEVILTNPVSSADANYILKIDNNSRVFISKLKFMPTGSYSRSIVVNGNSDTLSFQSNIFLNEASTTSWNNEAISFYPDGNSDADDIRFELNSFYNGGYHVLSYPNSSLSHSSDWSFWANGHTGGYGAVYLKQASDIDVRGEILNDTTNGIMLEQCSGELALQRCNIYARINGISITNSSFTASATPQIFNNLVKMSGTNIYNPNYDSDAYGISVNGANVFVAHNTVDNQSQTSGSVALSLGGSNLVAKNNHLVASGMGMALYLTSVSGLTIEHNNLYSAYLNLAKIGNNYCRTLLEYAALAGGTNYSVAPCLDSQLHTATPWLDNHGLPCGLASDYDNNPRNPDTPDIGAYEYTSDPALTPLSGTVSVGEAQNYSSLTELFGELTLRGINGNLDIALTDSLYTEQFVINAIPGSENYFITLQPQGRTQAVLRFSEQSVARNYLIRFVRTSNLSFQHVNFETPSTTYSNLLLFEGYNYYPRFLNCKFNAPNGSSGYSLVTPYGSKTPELDVLACDFSGNHTGIYHFGNNSTLGSNSFCGMNTGLSLNQSDYCAVSGNGFTDCSSYSIQVNGGKSLRILRNTSIGSATGIYVSNLELNGTERNLIANNTIRSEDGNMHYGISLGGNGINLINNTFQVSGTNSFGLYCYQPGTNVDIVNNIFVSEQAHAVEFTYFSPSADKVIDYNCYYSPTNYLVRFGSYFTSLADLQAAFPTLNQHSVSYNPLLTEDLHTQSPWLRRIGILRNEITTDMDNEPRGELFDIGADQQTGEYGFTPLSGTYTIGSGGQYATLQSFLAQLSLLGASSSVTAQLLPGVHAGSIVVSDFPRISTSHYLTITALSGASIQLNPQSSGQNNFIFRLDGVDRVIFENLNLSSTNDQTPSYYLILNGKCDDIRISNCSFSLGSSYNDGIYATNSINDGLRIENCQFTGGDRAIYLRGSGYTSDLYQNIRVESSSFSGTNYPLEISRTNNLKLLQNSFSNFSSAMLLSYVYGNSDIMRNSLIAHHALGSYSSKTLVSLDNLIGTQDTEIEILANIVYAAHNSLQALIGINLSNSTYVRLYHNTVSVENTYSYDYGAAYAQSNCSHLMQVNNIFASVRSGYALSSNNCSDNYFAHNAYYSGGKYLVNYSGSLYEPLAGISALTDANGVFANPYVDENGYTTASYLGNKGAASYVQSDINYVVFGINIPVGASFVAYQEPLDGSVQIGSAFPDLPSALTAAMQRGVSSATAFILPAGTYNVSSEIGYIPNTLQNSFSISSSQGAILTHNAAGEADNYLLKLRNLRNFNLYGISFAPQNSNLSRCIVLERYNSGILIEDCDFSVSGSTNTSTNSAAIYASAEAYDDISVISCHIANFAYGISIGASNPNTIANGLLLQNNTINNAYYGIYTAYSTGAVITDNIIGAYRSTGIGISYGKGDLQVLRNRVTGNGTYALSLVQHSEGSPVIANNYLQNGFANSSATLFLESANLCKVYFNTLVCGSNYSNSAAFYQSGGVSQLQFINNICKATGGKGAIFQNPSTLQSYDHNLFFSSLGSAVSVNGSAINGLASWTALTGDTTCVFSDPLLNGSSYDLLPASPAINAGIELAGYAHDIEGRLRTLPDIGCREYSSAWLDAPTHLQISYDHTTQEIVLSWNAVSGASSYMVYYADNPEMAGETGISASGTTLRLPAANSARFFRVSARNME